uniref:Zinc finger CHCC-type domain-containing protein n=1 Tax=Spongospora subterranea TaxID=70186 RepID=A0A0H5R5L0_9EUKA|eukprot:CRZ09151.1 hypothetical protein [Spongospora subterranea]
MMHLMRSARFAAIAGRSSWRTRFALIADTPSGNGERDSPDFPGTRRLYPASAIDLISLVPPIAVESYTAVCDGGGGALGHPIEYIMLDTRRPNMVETCKYCGTRFVHKSKGDHHH